MTTRIFFDDILAVVKPGDKILDLGCGTGDLMQYLITHRSVNAYGIDINQTNILACLRQNLNVIDHDINTGLAIFDKDFFDVVIFSETLQEIINPGQIIQDSVRIGKKCIISFPNFSFFMNRLQLILGRAPQNSLLPYAWFESPNIRFLSIADFEQFCETHAITIESPFRLYDNSVIDKLMPHWARNIMAPRGRFVITAMPVIKSNRLAYLFEAIRPKTLPVSVSPVILGTALAAYTNQATIITTVLITGTILCLQISANLMNDYYDAVKGGDANRQYGPRRLTQTGLISQTAIKRYSRNSIVIAGIIALPLIVTHPIYSALSLGIGLFASYAYTGGRWPLAYHALGEVTVFWVIGPVATLYVYYLHTATITLDSLIISFIPGSLAAAVLVINNTRDQYSDAVANKNTIVVRFGVAFARLVYYSMLVIALSIPAVLVSRGYPSALYYSYGLVFLLVYPAYIMLQEPSSKFNHALAQTGIFLLLFSVLIAIIFIK